MIDFWANFVSEMMVSILARAKIDCVVISEDMTHKTRSMISSKMVRELLLPVYQRWVSEIEKGSCPIISLDSDGYIGELIPI